MILAAITPAVLGFMIFFGSLRQTAPKLRVTTRRERDAAAAVTREFRMLAGRALLVLLVFGVPLGAIVSVHHFTDQDFRPQELR